MYPKKAAATIGVLDPERHKTIAQSFGSVVWRTARRIGKYFSNHRQYDELLEMPDYLLADVGLSRAQVIEVKRDLRL
ncbi:hypothetical protein DLJ53_28525 [Acuticoccus sediminis]|uniref:YjiS-like domain-containing protein n=1 Tax=Acuticoccus sediminis TaxID=2184697 RepID=A0A8B2NN11_9HYPH|nr:DUF1127 domain-containing protein [Acuticoccus sediminis]RAH97787.1 hypothetical protein DLJ53_28525 [Acuticoccus sediminis]